MFFLDGEGAGRRVSTTRPAASPHQVQLPCRFIYNVRFSRPAFAAGLQRDRPHVPNLPLDFQKKGGLGSGPTASSRDSGTGHEAEIGLWAVAPTKHKMHLVVLALAPRAIKYFTLNKIECSKQVKMKRSSHINGKHCAANLLVFWWSGASGRREMIELFDNRLSF